MDRDSTVASVELDSKNNSVFALPNEEIDFPPPKFKSFSKNELFADKVLYADNIINDNYPPLVVIDDQDADDGIPPDNGKSSLILMILLPLASVIVLTALAAAIRWRYSLRHQQQTTHKSSTNNNDYKKNTVGLNNRTSTTPEEEHPLKRRSQSSTSSSISVLGGVAGASGPVTVSMRIVSETETKEFGDSRRDNYYRINSNSTKSVENLKETFDSVQIECEVLKEKVPEKQLSSSKLNCEVVNQKTQLAIVEKQGEIFPKRPKTLSVMTVVDGNTDQKMSQTGDYQWTDQLWTPDADIIYEDTSPGNDLELNREGNDILFPLMAKGRTKMKPKGLLERRGSNVALTISLNNEEKVCTNSNSPTSSKSPKPLVYLRTATCKLDMMQLHIKSAETSKLQQEFWEVPMNHPSEKHLSIPGYGTKNRYRSILPNPHSRVKLPPTPSEDLLSTYINANYVRGYQSLVDSEKRRNSENGKENDSRRTSIKRKAAFIATQGPMANTISDFWKMVWKENSNVIVMITKLKERKEKCSEYTPSTQGEKHRYNTFEVEVKNVRHADHFIIRTLEVRNSDDEGVVRTIFHFWYSEWLDHETPEKTRGLLQLIQEVEVKTERKEIEQGPAVIHCSAGIGRTGCFIAISIGSQQIKEENKVDILRIICQMRMDRGGMIQTWEQYQYVHLALSRYSRMLAGEVVATPSTASSVQSPRSRHSTPVSARSTEEATRGTPNSLSRLMSPRFSNKTELSTVSEAKTPSSANATDISSEQKVEDRSIFSPKPQKDSHFSFSQADQNKNFKPHPKENTEAESKDSINTDSVKEVESRGIGERSLEFLARKKAIPLQLALKIQTKPALKRDENWLLNGHCDKEKEVGVERSHRVDKVHCQGDHLTKAVEKNVVNEATVTCQNSQATVSTADHGKTNVNAEDNCQTPAVTSNNSKRSFFEFPSPEK